MENHQKNIQKIIRQMTARHKITTVEYKKSQNCPYLNLLLTDFHL